VFQMDGFARHSAEKFVEDAGNENDQDEDATTPARSRYSSESPSLMGTSVPVGIPRSSLPQQQQQRNSGRLRLSGEVETQQVVPFFESKTQITF